MLQRAEVERPIASLRESALLAEQLAEQHRQLDAARREDAEVAVQRQDVVVGLERRSDPDGDGFLPDAREPLGQPVLPQQPQHLLFDQARPQQRFVERAQLGV